MHGKGTILGACLFLVLLTFGLYYSSLDNSFHYDDGHAVVDNPWIRDLRNIPKFFVSNTLVSESPQASNYRPVLMVTYALNYALGGLDPWGFHLVNVLIHALTVLVCFGLIRFLLGDVRAALFGALIFAIHPMNSEAVNYITARSSILSTLFVTVALLAYHRFRTQQGEGRGAKSWFLYGLSLLAFLLALLSKETALVLPGLILLTDLVFHSDRIKDFYKQTLFLYLPWIGLTLWFLWIKGKILGGNAGVILAGSATVESSPLTNALLSFLTGLKLVGRYILTALWPIDLAMDHNLTRVSSLWEGALLLPILMIGVFLVGTIWFWKREKVISFGILWFFIALLPVIYLPFFTNVALFQENRGYAAMIGLGILAGVAFRYLLERTTRFYRTVGAVVIVLLLVFYMVIVLQRNAVWQDQFTLWSDAAKKSPLSPEPHISLAMLYRAKGDMELAFQEIQEALRLAPEHGLALHLLGDFYSQQGNLEKAVEAYERSLSYAPGSWKTYTNLGTILSQQGQVEKAIERYRQALRLNPGDWIAHQNMIVAYARQNQLDQILKEYEEAIVTKPDAYYYHYGQGVAYELLRRGDDAKRAYTKSIELYPGFVEGFIRLCQLNLEQGNSEGAARQCETALKIDSHNWAAHYTLGLLAEQKEDLSVAMQHYLEALKINPKDVGTHFNLGNVYRRTGQTEQAIVAYRASVELNPDFLRGRFNLAKLLEQNGRQAEAVEQYRQITLRAKEGKDDVIKMMAAENLNRLSSFLKK